MRHAASSVSGSVTGSRLAMRRPTGTSYWIDTPRSPRSALQSQCRSEEHTSELQSRLHLVCRLLLEKKKNDTVQPDIEAEHKKRDAMEARQIVCRRRFGG